jgi:hypothetical protein
MLGLYIFTIFCLPLLAYSIPTPQDGETSKISTNPPSSAFDLNTTPGSILKENCKFYILHQISTAQFFIIKFICYMDIFS